MGRSGVHSRTWIERLAPTLLSVLIGNHSVYITAPVHKGCALFCRRTCARPDKLRGPSCTVLIIIFIGNFVPYDQKAGQQFQITNFHNDKLHLHDKITITFG